MMGTENVLLQSDLKSAIQEFFTELARFIGTEVDGAEIINLRLDGKLLENKKEMSDTNGPYPFADYEIYRKYYIPNADSPGVYIFFDGNDVAKYVGKSETEGGIGIRVDSHIQKRSDGQSTTLEFADAKYVITIPFDSTPWLAPAFESFLLNRYKFAHNRALSKKG